MSINDVNGVDYKILQQARRFASGQCSEAIFQGNVSVILSDTFKEYREGTIYDVPEDKPSDEELLGIDRRIITLTESYTSGKITGWDFLKGIHALFDERGSTYLVTKSETKAERAIRACREAADALEAMPFRRVISGMLPGMQPANATCAGLRVEAEYIEKQMKAIEEANQEAT